MSYTVPTAGMREYLAIRVLSTDQARVVGEMVADGRHLDEDGWLRGAVVIAFADELGMHAAASNLPAGKRVVTLESKANFFRPCSPGRIVGEAVPLHIGQDTMVWQTSVQGPDGGRVATVMQTQLVSAGHLGRPAAESNGDRIEHESSAPTRIARQRLDQIYDAARRVFAVKGFANATVKEIAAAAGLHVPTMYQYVRSKDDLLAAIFVTTFERIAEEVTEATKGAGTARERLRRAIAATLGCYDRCKTEIRLISRETKALEPNVRARVLRQRADFVRLFARIVADGIAAGEFDEGLEPELVANVAVTMCELWPLRRFAVSRFGLRRVEEEILTILLHGVERAAA